MLGLLKVATVSHSFKVCTGELTRWPQPANNDKAGGPSINPQFFFTSNRNVSFKFLMFA